MCKVHIYERFYRGAEIIAHLCQMPCHVVLNDCFRLVNMGLYLTGRCGNEMWGILSQTLACLGKLLSDYLNDDLWKIARVLTV